MVDVKHKWNTVQNNTFLLSNYPDLSFTTPDRIEGKLKFSALFDRKKGVILINPTIESDSSYFIEDTYSIKIELPNDPSYQFPIVFETDGRIISAGKKYGIVNFLDIHVYKDNGNVCLCPQPQLIERIITGKAENLQLLIDELIIPYFYQQSYFECYGHWPIKNYSHDYPAIFEYYFREKNKNSGVSKHLIDSCTLSLKNLAKRDSYKYIELLTEPSTVIKSTSKCFCGSGRKYKKCHRRKFSKEAKVGFTSYLSDLKNK